jgi:hypothetical protein
VDNNPSGNPLLVCVQFGCYLTGNSSLKQRYD